MSDHITEHLKKNPINEDPNFLDTEFVFCICI